VQKGQQKTDSGIYAYSARDVFTLQHSKYRHLDLIVSVSFFEIYSGKVRRCGYHTLYGSEPGRGRVVY